MICKLGSHWWNILCTSSLISLPSRLYQQFCKFNYPLISHEQDLIQKGFDPTILHTAAFYQFYLLFVRIHLSGYLMFIGSNVQELKGVGVQVIGFHKVFIVYEVTPNAVLSYWALTGLVTKSNIFCEPFAIKDQCKKFIERVKPASKVGIICANCVLLTLSHSVKHQMLFLYLFGDDQSVRGEVEGC